MKLIRMKFFMVNAQYSHISFGHQLLDEMRHVVVCFFVHKLLFGVSNWRLLLYAGRGYGFVLSIFIISWTWTWYGGCLLQVCDSQFLHIQLLCKFTCMNWQYPAVIICFSGLVPNLSKIEGRDSRMQRRGMIWYLLLLGMGTFTHVVFSHFWNVNHIQKKVGSNRLL
jgi:hypothetical protein